MIRATNIRALAVAALALTALAARAAPAMARSGSAELFIRSAVEHADGTATFPLQRGSSGGRTVWYVVLDSSSGAQADARGINRAQKLANAGAAVQDVRVVDGVVEFPATVDFSPVRRVVPGPAGFPPLVAEPGARAEGGYSPLIRLPDGSILNART